MFGAAPVFAQPAAPQSPAPSPSPVAPDYSAESERFQARIDATARALRDLRQYKSASPKYLEGLVEFPEFEDLYRDYGSARADGSRTADSSKRKSTGLSSAYKPTQHSRKLRH
jgi:hypothetical protein